MKDAAAIHLLRQEFDQYYMNFDSYESHLLPELAERIAAIAPDDSFARKTAQKYGVPMKKVLRHMNRGIRGFKTHTPWQEERYEA